MLTWALPPVINAAPAVSLLIADSGSEIYELEGHAALRINYGTPEADYVVNWGVFDFNSPNFVYRFVKGETDYICAAAPTSWFVADYVSQGRKLTELSLAIDDDSADRLAQMVATETLPQNRTYRYNYVRDNCATRPLARLEQACGGQIILAPEDTVTDLTFRKEMTRYHSGYPWYQFGIDLALGSGIDKKISRKETTFAPVALEHLLEDATLGTDSTGNPVKLVSSKQILYDGEPGGVRKAPTPWYLTPMAIGWLLFAISVTVTILSPAYPVWGKWFDTIIYTVFGLAGCVLFFLVFISTHEATSPNYLLLWLNPLCLTVPLCIWLKKGKRVVYFYQIVNFVAILALCTIWLCGVQSLNAAFAPLILLDMLRALSYTLPGHICRKKTT